MSDDRHGVGEGIQKFVFGGRGPLLELRLLKVEVVVHPRWGQLEGCGASLRSIVGKCGRPSPTLGWGAMY